MVRSVIFALVAVLPSLLAVNGAVIQRDGTFPTSPVLQSSVPTSSSVTLPTTSSSPSTSPTTAPTCPTITSSVSQSSVPPTTSVTVPKTSTSPTTTSSTSAPSPSGTGTANCNGVQQWQAAFAYTAGNKAIFNNQLYTALQWTYNNSPPAHPDQWSFGGACAQPIVNQANCQGVAAWQSTTAYTTGSQVTFNNHLWSAVQWVESNAPGGTAGAWKDLGACA